MLHESRMTVKGQRTRGAILKGAAALAARIGPGAVTVQGLCAEAGVGRPSFYTYFRGVEEVLDLVGRDATEKFARTFGDAHADMPRGRARLEVCLTAVMDFAQNQREDARLLAALAQKTDSVSRILRREIASELAAEGLADADDLAEFIAISTLGVVDAITRGTVKHPSKVVEYILRAADAA